MLDRKAIGASTSPETRPLGSYPPWCGCEDKCEDWDVDLVLVLVVSDVRTQCRDNKWVGQCWARGGGRALGIE